MGASRKYLRYYAKQKMKKKGLTQICKTKYGKNKYPSYFSMHWRDAIN